MCSDVDPAGQNGILNESQWVTLTVVNILFALLFLLLGIFMFLTVALRVHPECVILRFLCLSNTHTHCVRCKQAQSVDARIQRVRRVQLWRLRARRAACCAD